MFVRAFASVAVLLAGLALVLASCAGDGGGAVPAAPPVVVEPGLTPPSEPTPVPAATTHPAPTQIPELFKQQVPPCTAVEGASVDPCQPGFAGWIDVGPPATTIIPDYAYFGGPPGPFPVDWYVRGYRSSGTYAAHLVARATYLPNTIRCIAPETFRDPPRLVSSLRNSPLRDMGPGGVYRMTCFADARVGEYVVGSGPAKLTIIVGTVNYHSRAANWPPEKAEADRVRMEQAFTNGGTAYNLVVPTGLPGQERILFLSPSRDTLIEAWQSRSSPWDVQRGEGGVVMVIHPHREYWQDHSGQWDTYQSQVEMTLADFKAAVLASHQARMTEYGGRIFKDPDYPDYEFPMLRTNANDLPQYMRDVGAYTMEGGPPEPPPPACGLVVADQMNDSGLLNDCRILLEARDQLRGTGTLNWSTGTAMAAWNGVTVAGTPKRVTKLKLENKSLNGTIPFALAGLTELNELKLAGNTLAGCIPVALRAVASHDLDSLGLLYCPPAPGGLTGTGTENSVALSWDAVPNTSKYQLQYRTRGSGGWAVASDTLTGTTHMMSELNCDSAHWFRVGAYGNATTYAAAWSEPSAVYETSTGTCVTPAFDQDG